MENIKARTKRLMDCFNLTLEGWDAIDQFQKGLCFICGKRQKSGKRLATDHRHSDGLVRGLLCNHCNHLLGKIENALTRYPAADYEEKRDFALWTVQILTRLITYMTHPPATEALGAPVYGYAGRVGTKKHRADLKRREKLADNSCHK